MGDIASVSITNIQIHDGKQWVVCPHCRKRLLVVNDDTIIARLPMRCKMCHREFEINYIGG